MRVLTFLHSFEPGGVERDALRLCSEWTKLGVDTPIALGRTEGPLAAEAPPLDYHIYQKGRFSTRRYETLYMVAKLPATIRALKPDVLFCAGNTYSIVAVLMRLMLGKSCPPIVLKVSNDLERADLPWIARTAYHLWLRFQSPFFAAIVGMAEPARAQIVERMQAGPDRVSIINNASIRHAEVLQLAQARRAQARAHKGRRFLAVGRLVAQKNFTLLVKAFAAIAEPYDELTIVGEGPMRRSLERLIKRLGLTRQVFMPGHVNPLDSAFARADAFVLSSDYEGLGVVVVEALAAGIPIAATNCCVNMSLLVDGAGELVPIGDTAALGQAMLRVTAHRADVPLLRARAEAFTVESTAPAWVELFTRVAQARFPARRNVARGRARRARNAPKQVETR